MKKALRPILSILLAFAMILPLAGVAKATDDPVYATKVTVTATPSPAYYPSSTKNTVTVTATIEPDNYNGTIEWTVSNSTVLTGTVPTADSKTRTFTLTAAQAAESVTITATVVKSSEENGVLTGTATVSVTNNAVTGVSLSLGKSAIEIGGTTTATASATRPSGETNGTFTYSSDRTDIATVDSSGNIKGVGVGTATITVTETGSGRTDAKEIEVTPVSFSYSGTKGATVGQSFPLSTLHNDLVRKFTSIAANDKVTFTNVGSSSIGSLSMGTSKISNNSTCTLTQLSSVAFLPVSDQDFAFNVSVKHGDVDYSAAVTISSTLSEIDLLVPIDDDSSYSFATKSANGKYGYRIITDAFKAFDDFATSGSIVFSYPSKASQRIGTLSTTSKESGDIAEVDYVNAEDLDDLYFLPLKDSGTYEVDYEAYSEKKGEKGSGYVIAKGTLSITVNAESLDVTVKLDSAKPYTFSKAANAKSSDSAEDLLVEAINSVVGKRNWGGVYFDTAKVSRASNAVGTLYIDDTSVKASNELGSDDYVDSGDIGDLYFVPDESGTYEVTFEVYSTSRSTTALASGTLTISVNDDLGDMDFQYATTTGGTVKLLEKDFTSYVQDELGSKYDLAYVTLDNSSGSGTFYNGSAKFTPSSRSEEYYAEDYDDAPRKASYISDLSFTAPATGTGHTSVKFTAYGVDSKDNLKSTSGVFYIFYSTANVPAITCNIYSASSSYNAVALRESDFVSVYKTVMKVTTANPQFRIRFLTLPVSGQLYQNFKSMTSTGTRLTSSDLNSTTFYIGSSTSSRSVSTLSYVGLVASTAADTATYVVLDSSDTPLYTGSIRFILSAPKSASVSSEGLDFTVNDFADINDPVLYVTFAKPASGKLYVSTGSRMIAVTESTKLYTTNATDGTYPVSLTHYVPQYNQTATVTLTYTAHTKSGATYEGSIIVTPSKKTASTRFTDIPAGTAGWAADSIDFAYKYNLVKGTGGTNFSPDSKMHRCDLVLILYRLAGSPAVSGTVPYTDVAAGTTSYATEIYNSALWASKNGIVDGLVSNNQYLPNSNITRQEYIRILYNYAKYTGASVTNSGSIAGYTDASKVASFATEAMKWSVANNYITSTETGRLVLSPEREATRAEIVTLLHRYLTY